MGERKIIVRQTRSTIRRHKSQLATLQALGLGRIGRQVEHKDSAELRGMLGKVAHLVQIAEVGK